MRKRDVATVMLSLLAIFLFLQLQGDFSFTEAWFHLSDEHAIKHEAERLPPPIVTDLNGDGKKEVLVATFDSKIQLLDPHSRRGDGGFSEARVLAEISLLPSRTRVASGRRAVAMATGAINTTGQPLKQVLVVVTFGWSIMCFDHNLQKLWEANLQADFPYNAYHREIAVLVTNHTVMLRDTGLVLVAGRMVVQPHINLDPLEEIGTTEKYAEQHGRNASERGASELQHFFFYAFSGQSGSIRWSRKNEDMEAQPSDSSHFIPQLDVHALDTRRPAEFECREFSELILGVMPHHWGRREDTQLKLSRFIRGRKRKHLVNFVGKTSREVAKFDVSANNMKVMPYFPPKINYTQFWWLPNVVVAHQKEGIEVIQLASGRSICTLHLQEGGLHADINGDGVLDHVQAVGGNEAEQTVSGSMEVLRPCWAVATSGVPVREQLFNASICHRFPFNLFKIGRFSRSRTSGVSSLEVATPIFIPNSNGQKHHKESHGVVVFLTNRGEVTSYITGSHSHAATLLWNILTGSTWSNLPFRSGMIGGAMRVPTLKAFSLRSHNVQHMILAAGDQKATVISLKGRVQTSVDLPAPPTHALICDDFSNDGLTDLIVVTSNGVYGFVQTRKPGALFFSILVGCLLIVMGILFFHYHLNSNGKPRGSRQ